MSSPSALLKVNYLVIRHLHFRNARGDLQEGHVYAKRLRGYTFRSHFPLCSSTKSGFLCQKGQLFPGFAPSRAQNREIGVFVLGKSNRREGVGRKGAVISETLTALNIQKKSFFCCLFRLFSNFAPSFGSRLRD